MHSVIWCGRKQSFTITKRIGVSQAEKQSVEGTIEGTIGVAALTSIKNSVKGVLQQEVAWETEVSSSQNFEFVAPKCGRLTALIMQLVRSYDFHYEDRRWLHRDSWSATLTEHTIYLYDDSKQIAWDERCRCEGKNPGDYHGILKMLIGPVSALIPYRRRAEGGVDLQFGTRTVATQIDVTKGFQGAVRREWLPPYVPFLVGRLADTYEATFEPHELGPFEATIEVAARVKVAPEEESADYDTPPPPYLGA